MNRPLRGPRPRDYMGSGRGVQPDVNWVQESLLFRPSLPSNHVSGTRRRLPISGRRTPNRCPATSDEDTIRSSSLRSAWRWSRFAALCDVTELQTALMSRRQHAKGALAPLDTRPRQIEIDADQRRPALWFIQESSEGNEIQRHHALFNEDRTSNTSRFSIHLLWASVSGDPGW